MAVASHIELFQSYCRPSTKCKWRSQVGPQISTHQIYNFGDNAIFVL